MDIWMVAVAAGAGCIAQHFKNFKNSGGQLASESSSDGSYSVKPESPKQPPDKKWPFLRREKRENRKQDDFEGKTDLYQGVSGTEMTSTSGEKEVISGNCEGNSVFSTSSLFPGFFGSDVEVVRVSEVSSPRNRSALRSRRTMGRAIRPLSALESSLMAQLYTEHVEMKEHMFGSFASPSMQTLRPFLVTDGNEVINNGAGKKMQAYSDENGAVFGVPPLPNLGSLEIRGKDRDKDNNRRDQRRRSSNSRKTAIREHFNLRRGSSDATLLLCLGMSFGIISSFMANRREVEKLNLLLKQTESLVQDLQEELDMKDSLVLQELTIEDQISQQTDSRSLNDGSPRSVSHDDNNKESVIQESKEESFSKIEAELEAELEMLELNMSSSTLERRISNLVEIDPDFEPDVTQGELRADTLYRQDSDKANTNRDRTGSTTTPHSVNYAVSPRELSLRLHEVLESQLKERIKILEAEIENKETRNHKSWKDFLSCKEEEEDDDDDDDRRVADEPVVLNLSGEALDAYNEACNEFAKLDESDEEEDDDDNGGFGEDEMEKLLIKHIVEKARKGSPVVLNAQRVLFSE